MQSKKESEPMLKHSEKLVRDWLINNIQDLIYALKFETGPKPKGKVDNLALFVVTVIEQEFF
ncbi:MAG: hypothetical protein H0U57_03440 [Tatlockia sp.]|nr:hypothetical protein [Tatlockia sp.]